MHLEVLLFALIVDNCVNCSDPFHDPWIALESAVIGLQAERHLKVIISKIKSFICYESLLFHELCYCWILSQQQLG